MNRNTPLERGEPLKRTPFTRRVPPPSEPKTPRKRTTKDRAPTGEAAARAIVYARSGGVCELNIPGVCLGRATNWAHRLPAGQGGQWRASNGLHLCGMGNAGPGCHPYSESHRTESYAKGWLLKRGQDPLTEPALLWPTGLVLLDDEGGVWMAHPDDLPIRARLSAEEDAA